MSAAVTDSAMAVDADVEAGKQDELTSEERWSLLWAAVNIYYTFDAACGFAIASAAFIAGLLFKALLKSECENSIWVVSLVILAVRCVDVGSGCYGTVRNPVPTRSAFFKDVIRNIFICSILGILALVQLIMSIASLASDGDDCTISAVIGIISALLLLSQAFEEMPVWIIVLVLWCIAGSRPVPNWADSCIPQSIKDRAMANRKKHQAKPGEAPKQ